jgi:hypothetical protein
MADPAVKVNIPALRALEAKAAHGPWYCDRHTGKSGLYIIENGSNAMWTFECEGHEARLIAAMRNALPALCDVADCVPQIMAVLNGLPHEDQQHGWVIAFREAASRLDFTPPAATEESK